jgi:hypothetical protein
MSRQRLVQILRLCSIAIAAVGVPLYFYLMIKVGGEILSHHLAKAASASSATKN